MLACGLPRYAGDSPQGRRYRIKSEPMAPDSVVHEPVLSDSFHFIIDVRISVVDISTYPLDHLRSRGRTMARSFEFSDMLTLLRLPFRVSRPARRRRAKRLQFDVLEDRR